MHKRVVCLLFAVGLLMTLTVPALAAEAEGVIRITPHRAGEIVIGGEITLYYVGVRMEEEYYIWGRFLNWKIKAEEVYDPDTAREIRKMGDIGEGVSKRVGKSGTVTFTGLEQGLYLVVQTEAAPGHTSFQPFLLELPLGGQVWEAEAYPKVESEGSDNPQTGDHPAPIISAMTLVLSVSLLLILSDKRKR